MHIVAEYGLSDTELGLIYASLAGAGSGAYHQRVVCTLRGVLDRERLRAAWEALVRRHEALRWSFAFTDEGRAVRRVYDHHPLAWRECAQNDEQGDVHPSEKVELPPISEVTLVDDGHGVTRMIWRCHHAVADGWSAASALREVFEAYERPTQLAPSAPRSYREFVEWCSDRPVEPMLQRWRVRLADWDCADGRSIDPVGDPVEREDVWEGGVAAADTLRALARTHRATPASFVQACWAKALAQVLESDTVCFGLTVTGRPLEFAGADAPLGAYANTVPVCTKYAAPRPLSVIASELLRERAEAFADETVSLARIQQAVSGMGGRRLFDTVLVFQDHFCRVGWRTDFGGLHVADVAVEGATEFPLVLIVEILPRLLIRAWYRPSAQTERLRPAVRRFLMLLRAQLGLAGIGQ